MNNKCIHVYDVYTFDCCAVHKVFIVYSCFRKLKLKCCKSTVYIHLYCDLSIIVMVIRLLKAILILDE